MHAPVLYSFRRCPYAMRARLAIASAGVTVELREILLRDKAPRFLEASPKGTVPVLIADNIIEESFEIMLWALGQSDPEGLLTPMNTEAFELIYENDGPFKSALDRTKYAVRFPNLDPNESREKAARFIYKLNTRLVSQRWLLGEQPALVDLAILPFVRQFAHTDLNWWNRQAFTGAQRWLEAFKESERFHSVMMKFKPWREGDDVITFP